MSLCNLFVKFSDYCKKHVWQCILVILAEIMAFGFHATQYFYHIDMLVEEYYNGTVLIAAGRFSAPLINYLTNWMQFAPFLHTFLMAVFLFVAGLFFALVLKEASENKLSDTATFAFWIVFATFPVIAYQMTFPVLSVVLPYVLVSISLWILIPLIKNKKIGFLKISVAILLLTLSVDMYESHASVYLTMWFGILFIKVLFDNSKNVKIKNLIIPTVKSVLILATSIITDRIISKIICRIFCGTFDFWYSKNSTLAWFDDGLAGTIKWLFREIIARYVIAGISNYSVFLFDLAIVVGFIISLVISIKKKNALCVILFTVTAVASLSLAIVMGTAPLYRMAQSLPVFVALIAMLVIKTLPENRTIFKSVVWCIIGIIVFNQSLTINRYTVLCYERHQYEKNILMNISTDLQEYDIENKPILFVASENLEAPEFESTTLDFNNPIKEKYKKFMYHIFDIIIPKTTYKRLNARFGNNVKYELNDAESIDRFFNRDYLVSAYTTFNQRTKCPNFETAFNVPELYRAFDKIGCSLIVAEESMTADETIYPAVCDKYKDMPAYPSDGYIIETTDRIIVKIYD